MARVSTYLNFSDCTEKAFLFYRSIFGGDFLNGGIKRFRDLPLAEGQQPMDEGLGNLVLHVELKLLGEHVLMGTDAPEAMGFKVTAGNNFYINLEPDSKEEVMRLFKLLSEGGTVETEPQEMLWGAFYGTCTDQFGIQWMFHFNPQINL